MGLSDSILNTIRATRTREALSSLIAETRDRQDLVDALTELVSFAEEGENGDNALLRQATEQLARKVASFRVERVLEYAIDGEFKPALALCGGFSPIYGLNSIMVDALHKKLSGRGLNAYQATRVVAFIGLLLMPKENRFDWIERLS